MECERAAYKEISKRKRKGGSGRRQKKGAKGWGNREIKKKREKVRKVRVEVGGGGSKEETQGANKGDLEERREKSHKCSD